MIGKTIGQYKILEKLGGGGMGVVYKAEDTKLKRPVALKFLPPAYANDPAIKERFIHEARSASALQHANICTIHDISETEDGQMYIVMDYYQGETLKKKIEQGPLKIQEALDIALQIARGLAAAHEAGEIHRDIKPANIMVTVKGEVKIVDFGLAHFAGQTRLTVEGTTLGTVNYMSPEQTAGEEVDRRTDIWSLGVVLYEMISGQRPFKGNYDQAVMYAIMNEQPEPLTALRTGVSQELERIVLKILAKKPEERYQNISDLIVDLNKIKDDLEISTKYTFSQIKPEKPRQEKRNRIIIALTTVIILISAFILLRPLLFEDKLVAEPQPIVVISFKNQTGDPAYDYLQEAIPNLLITSLEQSKYLRVIPWERVYDLLKQLGKEDVDVIDEEIGYQICRMEGVEAIVLGSYVKAGDVFATDVKVLDVQSKRLLKSASAKGEGVGSILQNQIDQLSTQISDYLVNPETDIRGTTLRITDMTTSSMEAYHYFLKGQDAYDNFYYNDARRFLERSIQIDSTFALAYLYLSNTFDELNDIEARDHYYEKAKMYAANAGEKDRMYIDAQYAAKIEKNPQKRLAILEEMAGKYPKEKRVFFRLGLYYDGLKQYDKAIDAFQKSLDLDPQFGPTLNMLAYVYGDMGEFKKADNYLKQYMSVLPGGANPFDSIGEFYLRTGRLDQAINKYKEALEVKPDFGSEWRIAYTYALKEDYKNALLWIDKFINKEDYKDLKGIGGYWWKAFYFYLCGNFEQCIDNINKAEIIANHQKNDLGIRLINMLYGWIYLDQGDLTKSRKYYESFFISRSKFAPQYLANAKADRAIYNGLKYIKSNRLDSARQSFNQINALYTQLTPLSKERIAYKKNFLYMRILLAEDSLKQAEKINESLKPLETPFRFTWNYLDYNFPFSQDALAQIYLKKGRVSEAIGQYEKLIDTDVRKRGWRLINPLYHYRLAKLYVQDEKIGKAVDQYQRFIQICSGINDDSDQILDAKRQLQILKSATL